MRAPKTWEDRCNFVLKNKQTNKKYQQNVFSWYFQGKMKFPGVFKHFHKAS